MSYKAIECVGQHPNYYASIQKIEKVEPIEGSDNLVKATLCGKTVVLSKFYTKDMVVVYFPHECVISELFLSANNLYDLYNYKKNSNYRQVDAVLYEMDNTDDENKKKELAIKARSLCGYFDASGRVKTKRIRGVVSEGFAIYTKSITNMDSIFSVVDWDCHVGLKFDTLNTEQICWKYISRKEANILANLKPKQTFYEKAMKKIRRNANLVEDQFRLHYDTSYLSEFMKNINPYDEVVVTTKVDGSACCVANILVNKELNMFQKLWKKLGFNVKDKDYHVVYSSHHIIKSTEINPGATEGFYGVDIWKPVKDLLGKYLPKGMSIYGEIVGYIEGTDRMIQPDRDYGCNVGEWKFMPYRITETDENGNVTEWDMYKVIESTILMCKEHPDLYANILIPDPLYVGKFVDMYKDVPVDENWSDVVLERMKNDKDTLGMELDEPMCVIPGPREGVVVRIGNEAYKLKTQRHLEIESARADKGELDIESLN